MSAPSQRAQRLHEEDRPALEAWFATQPDVTLFQAANLERAGFADDGRAYGGTWAGCFESGRLVAVAQHAWNGMVVLAGSTGSVAQAAEAAVAASGRPVSGLAGPWTAIVAAEPAVAPPGQAGAGRLRTREVLMALEAAAWPVATPELAGVRRALASDMDVLVPWRLDYEHESLGVPLDQLDAAAARSSLERALARDDVYVLEAQGQLVAMTGFNARVRDVVQVGGGFTPKPLRSRGHARRVVAGSLVDAARSGARRSVLFTDEANHPALACYRRLGYRETGEYGFIFYA